MNTTKPTQRRRSGFTLIEMIGVLAIIAVLAALLIPRIFSAINESRVNGAALSYNSLKSSAISYFGKYGRFGGNGGTNFTAAELTAGVPDWDSDYLLKGGFVEKPFETKLGTGSTVEVRESVASTTAVTASNAAYDLDGSGATVNDATGSVVLQAFLEDVSEDDAIELNNKIDGTTLGAAAGSADLEGRVKYAAASGGTTTVYLYIAHK